MSPTGRWKHCYNTQLTAEIYLEPSHLDPSWGLPLLSPSPPLPHLEARVAVMGNYQITLPLRPSGVLVHRPFWSGLHLLSDHCPGSVLHSTTRGWPSFCALDKLSSFLPQGFSLAVALSGMFFLQIIPHLLSAEGYHLGSPLGQRCSLPRLLSVETLLECLL